ncbi:MAG: glycoside hydrolase family 127 protein, partial [Bacteroidaceae bacterium]|nr:glycoside hydrolase family 127 protein [Bacteroidaceae bacterium]
MIIRKGIILASVLAMAMGASAQIPAKVEPFSVNDVKLTQSDFKHAEDMDIRYLLGIDPDRLLAPYLKEAGLTPKAQNYTNWENTGLDGHIGGHYLSALSYMYASTGNAEIKGRLDYFISELKRCADANGNGYISGVPDGKKKWKEISEGNIRASSFGLNDGWVPLYNIHKIFAGLRDAYLLTGNKDAKQMFINLTAWMYDLTKGLSDDQLQRMLDSEHGGLNETFADAAAISGDERFMQLAKRFSHKKVLDPLLRGEDRLTGMHANTQIPKVIGYKRIADIEGNDQWDRAAQFFWKTVVDNRSITIGGNSVREHFHPADDFSSMLTSEQGPETCNTYNMLRLTKMLYETSADTHYMDYYERALYNHILSTVNPIQGGFVYFTPMRSGHYRVYSQPQTSFWCCVGSGMENHARYGEMIYSHGGADNLYVNLFIPSELTWGKTLITQTNRFPAEEATTITVNPKKPAEFTIRVRIPEWTDASKMQPTVNGQPVEAKAEGGYLAISRKWAKGDKLHVQLPMSLRAVSLPDKSDNYSFMYGPIVLASSLGKQEQLGLFADDSRGGHIAGGRQLPLQDMPVLVADKNNLMANITKVEGRPMTFRLTGSVPEKYAEMTLVPFSSLHECRYMVYWPVVSQQDWQAKQEEIARAEAERQAIEQATADKVICGEQQPESDHFVKMERVRNGDFNGRHWR